MSSQIINQKPSNEDKIDVYFEYIENRILQPIQNTSIKDYCTASLLIVFAAIDGVGQLLYPYDNAGSNERIKYFLDYMGGKYKDHQKEILKLRNSIVHNGLNVDFYLTHTGTIDDPILENLGPAGFILMNTSAMCEDVIKKCKQAHDDILHDPTKLILAANRLNMVVVNSENYQDRQGNIISPSPASSIKFTYTHFPKKTHIP